MSSSQPVSSSQQISSSQPNHTMRLSLLLSTALIATSASAAALPQIPDILGGLPIGAALGRPFKRQVPALPQIPSQIPPLFDKLGGLFSPIGADLRQGADGNLRPPSKRQVPAPPAAPGAAQMPTPPLPPVPEDVAAFAAAERGRMSQMLGSGDPEEQRAVAAEQARQHAETASRGAIDAVGAMEGRGELTPAQADALRERLRGARSRAEVEKIWKATPDGRFKGFQRSNEARRKAAHAKGRANRQAANA
ncbi:hypothetical protein EDC01DRAFT_334136 [Geopyxis carbonaria]|nr:hypothetical protein EDC01DRAFT_334136 [Geopyxis carbonaria]